MSDSVFLIDVCGTMFRSNTTFDFIRYYYGHSGRVRLWLSLPYRIYNRIAWHMLHREPLRRNLISMLRDKTIDELGRMADDFVCNFLVKREHRHVIELIERKRGEGLRLVIVSATIDVIASAVAHHYGINEYLSTQLDYGDDGVCRGYIKKDLLGDKRAALGRIGLKPPYTGIVTDNYSDADLVMSADEGFLVEYSNNGSHWNKILDNETIKRCHIIKV